MTRVVAVTGASGFLGRHVCKIITRRGQRVIGVGRSVAVPAELHDVITEWTAWDMTKPGPPSLPAGVDTIVHLAQSSLYRAFPEGARDMFDVNMRSTFELLETARLNGVSRFVYASSGGVYGGDRPASAEQSILARPQLGFYLMTKLASELFAKTYDKLLSVSILRLFFPFGPGQQADRLIPRLIQNVVTRQTLKLQGEQGLTINPIFVSDAAEAIARAVDSDSALTMDIAGREVISLRRLGDMIGMALRQEPMFEINLDQTSPSLLGDSRSMIDRLDYTPAVGLDDGIALTVADLVSRGLA